MNIKACTPRITNRYAPLGIAISISFVTSMGFTQPSEPAVEREAQALLESAVELMQKKQFPAACRKLEVVLQKLPQATGARLELAHCYRGEGRMASAWRQYVQVENLARIAGQKARVAEASKNATELARIVGKLQLDVPADVAAIAGLTITLDGQVQEPSSWGMPVPVDAMAHEIVATAPGREPWSKRIDVRDNQKSDADATPVFVKVGSPSLPRTSLRIDVPTEIARIPKIAIKVDGVNIDLSEWTDGALIEAGSHEIAVSAPHYEPWTKQVVVQNAESAVITVPMLEKRSSPPPLQPTPIPDKPTRKSSGFDKRAAGIVGMVTGGLSIGAGAILGGVAIAKNKESNDGLCTGNDCNAAGRTLRWEAVRLADASTATFIVGGVLAATGAVLIAISPANHASTVHRNAATTATPSMAHLWFGPKSMGVEYLW